MADRRRPSKPHRTAAAATAGVGAAAAPRGRPMWYVLGFLLLLALAQAFFSRCSRARRFPTASSRRWSATARSQEVIVAEDRIRGTLKAERAAHERSVHRVRIEDPKLIEELEQHGVKYTGEVASRWIAEVLSWVIPLLFLVALWSFFFRRMGGAEGGVMSFARSRAKIYADDDVKVSFADVAGVDEAEEELREIVEFLKTPKKYTSIGGGFRRACCSSALPAPARRCWRAPSPAKPRCPSSA